MPPASKKPDAQPAAEQSKPETARSKPADSYGQRAATLADDARRTAEDMRDQMDKLTEQVNQVQMVAPTVAEAGAADGVRRIPMAIDDVQRALHGLQAAAAELAQRTAG